MRSEKPLKINIFFSFPEECQLGIAFFVVDESMCPLPPSTLRPHLAGTGAGLMHVATISVSSRIWVLLSLAFLVGSMSLCNWLLG